MTTPEPMSPITEDDIADYLVNTPDFFDRHASLLATVQLTHPQSHRAAQPQPSSRSGPSRSAVQAWQIRQRHQRIQNGFSFCNLKFWVE